ncbi:DNA polymerase delta catalytic subunit [Lates japonicus]|uniref:DNA polymerase delta catalytic subunit n=1 Tax=Lates japonicus TaxID=270547 RepID=A0AAD3RLV2_LATJO|nr:DNA polymerase delta catalytic subunit [Lates japonicus]
MQEEGWVGGCGGGVAAVTLFMSFTLIGLGLLFVSASARNVTGTGPSNKTEIFRAFAGESSQIEEEWRELLSSGGLLSRSNFGMEFKRRNGGPPMGGASQAKRGKSAGEWEDSPSQFEEELSMFEDAEMEAEEMEGQAGHDVIPVGDLFSADLNPRWRRPHAPSLDSSSDTLVFQQIDLDYYLGAAVAGMPGQSQGKVPIIRMFGVTDSGNSVCCHVRCPCVSMRWMWDGQFDKSTGETVRIAPLRVLSFDVVCGRKLGTQLLSGNLSVILCLRPEGSRTGEKESRLSAREVLNGFKTRCHVAFRQF